MQKGGNESSFPGRRIVEFSCYIRIERNGVEVKKCNQSNTVSKVSLQEWVYQNKEVKEMKRSVIKLQFSQKEEYFSVEACLVEKVIDKMVGEGKLTLVVGKNSNDQFYIFFSKTTREVLDNFIRHLNKVKSGNEPEGIGVKQNNSNNSQMIEANPDTTSDNKSSNNQTNNLSTNIISTNSLPLNGGQNVNRKRKLQEMYSMNGGNNLQIKKFKKPSENTEKVVIIKKKINFLELPEDILSGVFDYVDPMNIIKVSLLNKECKNTYDRSVLKLKLRDDTPTYMYNILLKRFKNILHLSMGKSKHLKNENFKYFDVDLKQLTSLDISEITNLNDASIRKLFSKTKSKNITSLKMNFYLESLSSALVYIEEFFSNIKDLEICSNYQKHKFNQNFLKELENSPRYCHPYIYTKISELLCSKLHIKNLSSFMFYFSKIPESLNNIPKQKNLFSNLNSLNINILLIEKIKDLRLLSSASNLVTLTINEIVILNPIDKSLKRCDFEEIGIISNNLEMNPEDQLSNLTLDFDNDYIEIFINLFSKMKNLQNLNFGEFSNGEIVKIISLFCKGLSSLAVSSCKISDDQLKEILTNCVLIEKLDLRGCLAVQGNCFIELLDRLSPNLKNIKFSLTNFNFYNLFNILRNKGITPENYITKKY